jgi:hypothetical protein
MTTTNSPEAQPPTAFDYFNKGWTAEPASLYDEEGVEGWRWFDETGKERSVVIGAWNETPPSPDIDKAQPQEGELLPCPFCGSDQQPTVFGLKDDQWWVECSGYEGLCCKLFLSTTKEEAIRRWNTRAGLPRATADGPATTYKDKRRLTDAERFRWRKIYNGYTFNNCDHEHGGYPNHLVCAECAFELMDHFTAAPRATGETTVEAWQPIETAPKDGSAILVYGPELLREVNGHCAVVRWQTNEYSTVPWWTISDGKFGPHDLRGPSPTDWQPLPAPPDRAVTRTEGEGEQ